MTKIIFLLNQKLLQIYVHINCNKKITLILEMYEKIK